MVTAQHCTITSKQLQHKFQSEHKSGSESVNNIYQAVFLLFHKTMRRPSLLLSLSGHLSHSLSVVPHPVFLISGLSLRIGHVDVFFLQSKVLAVRHILHHSSDHFHTDAVVPSSEHCCTETVLTSSDHYCIEIVAPSGDHCFTETVAPSSDTALRN